jgi:hypothetical protein
MRLLPSYWRLAEKIGRTLHGIHDPVPTLNEKLGATMIQFFNRLPEAAVFERRVWLVHIDDQLPAACRSMADIDLRDAVNLVVRPNGRL